MTYPALSRSEARSYLDALKSGLTPEPPTVRSVDEGEDVDWESTAADLVAKLSKLMPGEPVKKQYFAFSAQCKREDSGCVD